MAQCLASLVTFLILTKPVTDMFWQWRIGMGSAATSAQGLLGLAFVALAVPLAVKGVRGGKGPERAVSVLFLVFSAMVVMALTMRGGQKDFLLKYLASLSAFVVVPWAFSRPRSWRFPVMAVVAAAMAVTVALQLGGVLPHHVFDNIHIYDATSPNHVMQVGRLSGAYYHPLDLMRVLIWGWLAFVGGAGIGLAPWVGAAALSAVALLTTHRATLVLMLCSCLAAAVLSRSRKRALAAIALLPATWALTGLVFHATTGKPILATMIPGEFYLAGSTPIAPIEEGAFVGAPKLQTDLVADNNIRFANGRGTFWVAHWRWVRAFAPSELTFGSGRLPIPLRELEPHSQLIDAFERFGIVGVLLLAVFLIAVLWAAPAAPLAKILCFMTIAFYGAMTEILVMPTFSLMAAAFLWWEPSQRRRP